MKKKKTATMQDWWIGQGRLHGKVYGHPAFTDGTEVTTSPIVEQSFLGEEEGDEVVTVNTIYILGKELTK